MLEYLINFGPGYRVYFGAGRRDASVILLTGGTKKRQRQSMRQSRMWAGLPAAGASAAAVKGG